MLPAADSLCLNADSGRFPNLAEAAALTIEVIQAAGETIFVPRCDGLSEVFSESRASIVLYRGPGGQRNPQKSNTLAGLMARLVPCLPAVPPPSEATCIGRCSYQCGGITCCRCNPLPAMITVFLAIRITLSIVGLVDGWQS